MAFYLVRVVLHAYPNPEEHPDYTKLHEEMEENRFYRKIQDDASGVWYELPPGEYLKTSVLKAETIYYLAKTIADNVIKKNAILLAETPLLLWQGLNLLK